MFWIWGNAELGVLGSAPGRDEHGALGDPTPRNWNGEELSVLWGLPWRDVRLALGDPTSWTWYEEELSVWRDDRLVL